MNNKQLAILTDDDYNYIISTEKRPFMIFFTAKWDENSSKMRIYLEQIGHACYENVKIYECDIDSTPLCATKSNIISIPCMVLYKEGKEYTRAVGYKEFGEIEEYLKKYEVI